MLSFDKRGELNKVFNYSTDVTVAVGGAPEKGWTGEENAMDAQGRSTINTFGVELEVSTDYTPGHIIDAFGEIFAICKSDASITGSKSTPMEIVTIPASLRKHKRNWSRFFKQLNEDMFDCLDKHNNGMHIHVGRDSFSKDVIHQKKFCQFFASSSTAKFLVEISERDEASIKNYANIAKSKGIAQAEKELMRFSKNCVVNLGKSATIEVRLFKGIVSYTSVLKNIEFVDSVVEFTRNQPAQKINLIEYLKYLDALPRGRYRVLKMCLEELNTSEMIQMGSILEALTSKKAVDFLILLNNNQLTVPQELEDRVIREFNEQHKATGTTLKKEGSVWGLVKQGTRFAKFDTRTREMFSRNAA